MIIRDQMLSFWIQIRLSANGRNRDTKALSKLEREGTNLESKGRRLMYIHSK